MAYILDVIGTMILLVYGVITLFFPRWVAPFIAQTLDSPRGVAEFRVIHGGFVGMAIFALVVNQPLVYSVVGIGWVSAAVARLVAIPLDRPPLNATYIVSFFFELAFGLMMIV
jgi:hypothetical protein